MRKKTLEELERLSPEETKKRPKLPCVLVLDNIRSGLNVGSVFRTADAMAVRNILLCGITAQPPHREILKTAIGATESVVWSYHKDTAEALDELKGEEYRLIGVEQTNESIPLQEVKIEKDEAYGIVFGNEVEGISDPVLPLLDEAWEIPQFGSKHSLNVSVSVGVVLWHILQPHLGALKEGTG